MCLTFIDKLSFQTETKGTVLIKTAQELTDFSQGEENLLESQIKAIVDSGAKVVVSGGKIGDLALHYLNKYGLMGVRLTSKWDVRRLCRAVGATPLPKLTQPTAEELGYADVVRVDELGDTSVVIFKMESAESKISTIVVRGATENYMDDIERAIGNFKIEIFLRKTNRELTRVTKALFHFSGHLTRFFQFFLIFNFLSILKL